MNQADRIRQHVLDRHVSVARREGRSELTLRAGDVHAQLKLVNALPAVCSAMGGAKMERLAGISLIGRDGPAAGSNVYFRFALTSRPFAKPSHDVQDRGTVRVRHPEAELDLSSALVLVSCVKSKASHPLPARSLYTSAWFSMVREIAEQAGARWLVLSSFHGLVEPEAVIAPYDYTLNSVGITERRRWAANVLTKLLPEAATFQRVVMFAGARYREFLIEPLERRGITVEVPMANLRRGEQLAWLSRSD